MYIFQKDDTKARAWSERLAERGITASAVRGSPLTAPLHLLGAWLKSQRISAYIFRYLNDYPSLAKTLLRVVTEVSTIAFVKVMRGRVVWIAHNVDRESDRYHPALSKIRRNLVHRAADAIFVLDPLLIPHAREKLSSAKRIDWVCFGRPARCDINSDTVEVREAIRQLRAHLQAKWPAARVCIGVCVSSPAPKCTHFLSVSTFVDRCTTPDFAVGVVVVGHVGRMTDIRYTGARQRMREHDQIVLIDRMADVKEEHLACETDFFYRAMDDYSVPFSLYVAASVRRPVITEAGTFLAEMVTHYELGTVAPENLMDTAGRTRVRELVEYWDGLAADRFLEIRSWSVAAEQLESGLALGPASSVGVRCEASAPAGPG